ncbi:MAG: sugar-binding protein [Planctomycetota bacterium]
MSNSAAIQTKHLISPFCAILFALAVSGCFSSKPTWVIHNPYQSVNWQTVSRYKANFHTHTTMSDGDGTPAEVIDRYVELGYSILALTDHDNVGPKNNKEDPERSRTTWPWSTYERDPGALGVIPIQGNEISKIHHIGSLFNDYGDSDVESETKAFEEIKKRGGLAILNHPGRYQFPVDWYLNHYRTHPHLVGLEIYNQGNRYPNDRQTWDAILTEIIQERPVWGFSNDDMHKMKTHPGRSWNVLLLNELTLDSVRQAMEAGYFFYVYSPEGHSGAAAPVIKEITVNPDEGLIAIQADGYDRVVWISDGNIVHQGETIDLDLVDAIGEYVRAEVFSGNIVIGSQPFRVEYPGQESNRKAIAAARQSLSTLDIGRVSPSNEAIAAKVAVEFTNPLDESLQYSLNWLNASPWTISPSNASQTVSAGETVKVIFDVSAPVSDMFPLPELTATVKVGDIKPRSVSRKSRIILNQDVSIPKIPAPPAIDGAVSDGEWKTATRGFPFFLESGTAFPSKKSEFFIAFDNDNLYVACLFDEPQIEKIRRESKGKERDSSQVWRDDCVEIFIDPNRTGTEYYQFSVAETGVQFDAKKKDVEWNAEWTSAVETSNGQWRVEIAIPFKFLGVDAPKSGDIWGFNVSRNDVPSREYSQWSCTDGDSHRADLFGNIRFAE